jgi:hypothetical protein
LLLDEVLATWDFRESHDIRVRRSPETVYRSLREVTPRETHITSALFAVRLLPSIIRRRPRPRFDPDLPLIDQFINAGFKLLAETPGEEMVAGVIGRFWKATAGPMADFHDREDFVRFQEAGYAKAAINFSVEAIDDGTRLASETRIRATDAAARRSFGRYWLLIGIGSATIRRSWLRAIKRRAEGAA